MEAIDHQIRRLLPFLAWSCNFQRIWEWILTADDRAALCSPTLSIADVIRHWSDSRDVSTELATVELARRAQVIPECQADFMRSAIAALAPSILSADRKSTATPKFANSKLTLPGCGEFVFRQMATVSRPCRVLQEFERLAWRTEVPSPFHVDQEASHQTLHRLNQRIGRKVFYSTHGGSMIGWRLP